MTSKNKNLSLLALLLLLAGLAAYLLFFNERKEETGADKDYFSIREVSGINSIHLEGPDFTHVFTRKNKGWLLNERYRVDENLMEVLQIILSKATVKRPVAFARKENVRQILIERGVKVTIYGTDDQLLRAFTVAGNDETKDSYFYDTHSNQAFIVYIPGYDSYIARVFYLASNEWRDKLIFSSTYRSLQSVWVNYPEDQQASFQIVFETDFFKIPGVESVDTTRMMDYLENLEGLRAEKVLENVPDSLSGVEPILKISVQDIDTTKNNTLHLYSRPNNDPYILGRDQKGRTMLLRQLDVKPFMVTKDAFKR